jgi:hypothetical protein
MAIGGDAVWDHAGHRPGGAEEGLGRREVPSLTEANIDEVAISINRSVKIAPLTLDFEMCFVHLPALPPSPMAPLAQGVAEEWSQLALPVAYRFMRKADPPLEKHFCQVPEAQLVAEAPEDDEADHIRRILEPIEQHPCAFIKDTTAVVTTKAALA